MHAASHSSAAFAQAVTRRQWLRRAGACAAAPITAGPVAAAPPPARREVPLGQPLPDVALRGLNTADRALSSFRGRPLLINVWASWCGPCVAEMGSLERLQWHEMMAQVQTIGVSTDDYRDRALALLKRVGGSLTHFIDRELEMEQLLGASSIPLTVLVDARGVVVSRIRGSRQWDTEPTLGELARTLGLGRKPASPATKDKLVKR